METGLVHKTQDFHISRLLCSKPSMFSAGAQWPSWVELGRWSQTHHEVQILALWLISTVALGELLLAWSFFVCQNPSKSTPVACGGLGFGLHGRHAKAAGPPREKGGGARQGARVPRGLPSFKLPTRGGEVVQSQEHGRVTCKAMEPLTRGDA